MQTKSHPISIEGSPGAFALCSFHFGRPGSGKKVYIQGGLHADEIPGMLVAQSLRRQLEELEQQGRLNGEIVLVPAANPLGLTQAIQGTPFGRFDLSTGTNFNRAYRHVAAEIAPRLEGLLGANPAANVATVRELARGAIAAWTVRNDAEAMKKILLGLAIDADIVLDLHCDNEAVLHMYAGTALVPAVMPLAALLGAQALLVADEAGEEPFDEACSRLWWDLATHFEGRYPIPPACVAATVELRGEMDVSYRHAEQDARALLHYLAIEGVVDLGPVELPRPLCAATPLEGVEPLAAPHAGIVVFLKELGETVRPGDTLADLVDPVSGAVTPIRAGVAGVFFARTAHRHLLRGMAIGKIAGPVPFRAGKLLSQ